MMKKALLIKQDLDLGLSWGKIAKKYGVGKSTIKNIKDNGRYYRDINTGKDIFTAKKISEKEQQFNYLCFHDKKHNGSLFKFNQIQIFRDRAVNPRLADFLGVSPRQTNRWSKKEQRLFGCDGNGVADSELVEKALEFAYYESQQFLKNRPYEYDDNGCLRGYKLWYVDLTPELLYYVKKYAFAYAVWKKENQDKGSDEFVKYVNDKFQENEYRFYNTRVGIVLGKWIIKNMKTYSFDYIKEVINYSSKGWWEDVEEKYYELSLPPIIYVETEAYYSGLLNQEQMEFVKQYM